MTTRTQLEIANDTSSRDTISRCIIEPARHSWRQVVLVLVLMVILGVAYASPFRTETANSFWNWVDPVAGIMAFFVSMVVLYNQARERWENSLEKRLTVSFVNASDNTELARVEHAYLAGESDIRQWTQQLGFQIFGDKLQLDMNWDDQSPPQIVREGCGNEDSFVKLYDVRLYVYFDGIPREKLNEFLQRRFKHSRVEGTPDSLPVRWIRCHNMEASGKNDTKSQQQEAGPQ